MIYKVIPSQGEIKEFSDLASAQKYVAELLAGTPPVGSSLLEILDAGVTAPQVTETIYHRRPCGSTGCQLCGSLKLTP